MVTPIKPYRARDELMVLKVSRYVTQSLSGSGRSVYLFLRACLPERVGCVRGVCVVTSFDVHINCSIPIIQLVHTLLIRRRTSGILGIRVSLFGRNRVMICVVYSSAVIESRSARY